MNKQELIVAMAEKSGLKKRDAEKALLSFIDTVKETLQCDEKITLVGFGTFETHERAAREGRNPQTGETIQIAASRTAVFKTGKAFKEALN